MPSRSMTVRTSWLISSALISRPFPVAMLHWPATEMTELVSAYPGLAAEYPSPDEHLATIEVSLRELSASGTPNLGIVTGTAYVITNGYNISDVPLELQSGFGVAKLAGLLPYPAVVSIVVALAASFLLRRTRFGLHTLGLGSSREAALRSGVKVRPTLMSLFVLAGSCAGICGFIDLSRYASTNLSGHQTDALAAIAGVSVVLFLLDAANTNTAT